MAKNAVAGLSQFEGRDVMQATVEVTNAGDGFSEALGIGPKELHLGEEVYLVIKTECVKVRYQELKDTNTLRRVHTLKASEGSEVEFELVKEVLEKQAAAIRKAKGTPTLLDDTDGDDDGEGDE